MAAEQISLLGTVVQGHQVASGKGADTPYPAGTIEMQKPFFKERGLDLTECFNGTLNIKIPIQGFIIQQADFLFKNICWAEGFSQETFSFLKCQILFRSKHFNGWVYYPHPQTKTQHFHPPNLIEIIAPKIPNITYGDELTLLFQRTSIGFIDG